MLKYKTGDKVVPMYDIREPVPWFNDEYVLVKEFCAENTDNEHYTVMPKDGDDDYSWLSDAEINHEATEALNK